MSGSRCGRIRSRKQIKIPHSRDFLLTRCGFGSSVIEAHRLPRRCPVDERIFGLNTASLEAKVKELDELIRTYTRSAKELWRLVPYLALQADGRSGYSSQYATAYQRGLWIIEHSLDRFSSYTVAVDCATGELVSIPNARERAHKEDVLRCASRLHELDAPAIVLKLQKAGRSPYSSCYDEREIKLWRLRIQEEYDLREVFIRKGEMPIFRFCWD